MVQGKSLILFAERLKCGGRLPFSTSRKMAGGVLRGILPTHTHARSLDIFLIRRLHEKEGKFYTCRNMVYFCIIPSGSKTRLGGIHGWSQRRVEIAGEGDEGEVIPMSTSGRWRRSRNLLSCGRDLRMSGSVCCMCARLGWHLAYPGC